MPVAAGRVRGDCSLMGCRKRARRPSLLQSLLQLSTKQRQLNLSASFAPCSQVALRHVGQPGGGGSPCFRVAVHHCSESCVVQRPWQATTPVPWQGQVGRGMPLGGSLPPFLDFPLSN